VTGINGQYTLKLYCERCKSTDEIIQPTKTSAISCSRQIGWMIRLIKNTATCPDCANAKRERTRRRRRPRRHPP
jgi:hypothetical protein